MCNITGNSEDAKISIDKSIQLWLPAHLKFLGKIMFTLRAYLILHFHSFLIYHVMKGTHHVISK